MFFKKKKTVVVTKRSEDKQPFTIPQIETEEEQKYRRDRFVSPVFGRKAKDEIVIPNTVTRKGDYDLQYDSFRTKPKLTKEDKKRIYGSEYHEFDLIQGSNLNEALGNVQKKQRPKEEPETYPNHQVDFEQQKPKTNINDFFDNKKEVVKEAINDFKESKEASEVRPVQEEIVEKQERKIPVKNKPPRKTGDYQLPPISLLKRRQKKEEDHSTWINGQIELLDRTLEEFKIGGRVVNYTKGPTVTRYEIALESGVNVRKIVNISDNLKMALAAKEIRIEAPIPGKSTVGIEVPNIKAEIVHFVDIIDQEDFHNDSLLNVALGLDIDGYGVYASIAKMPHGLVAGATGSGKSVCINTILMSLLFQYSPEELRLMLIDPKMVELASYNDLPHLLTPVITDAKIATAGLKWAVEEMERRFLLFANERVRDIKSYNKKMQQDNQEIMPYVVIIVDELADLMMVSSSSVEEAIMRLTQKARACGMHLIIATQRPSTDVVKGTIKSNIPTRIAFSVSSYIDSMTIIDSAGAEKLLGRGDMLFSEAGQPQIRVQGAYISDEEIQHVNDYIRSQQEVDYMFTQDNLVKRATQQENYDELLPEVARYVVLQGECSINKISKEFRIGFNRAQTIVESLADLNIVSDNLGSKARTVNVTMDELDTILE
jgi:S-DNA-T family DNA segregation ATPase FtsK/SpoIIIE